MSSPTDGRASLSSDERAALIAAHARRVESLRNSAQYRVGELVIAAARSPRRLARLPVDLWRLRKELLATHRITPPPPSSHPPARDVRVATILDEFSHRAFSPEWNQMALTTSAADEQLVTTRPDLLFVESAWEGNGGAFRYDLSHYATRQHSPLRDILGAATRAGIPTVFWSKEDPVHFDTFLAAAGAFDWIFTSDAERIEAYRRRLGTDRVAALPFAAQPRIHNPIGAADPPVARACFAGSWRADQYADRGSDLEVLLRPILDAGLLDIFDRMAAPGATGAPFPAPYDRAVRGFRSYDELLAEYRRYACFLNVNSVKSSPTMCSRRIFELLACRTPVVSTPSRAIDELLGDAVVTVDTQADAKAAVERLISDSDHRDRVGHLGYRAVLTRHTYRHRVDEILVRTGLGQPSPAPRVAVLAATNRPQHLDRLLANFAAQRDVDAELVVLTNADGFDRADVDRRVAAIGNARAIHLDASLTLGECLNVGLDSTGARFIAKFDDDDHYGPNYLRDALLVHLYVDAAISGKKSFFAYLEESDETLLRFPGNEFTYANRVCGATILIDRDLFADVRFGPLNQGTDSDLCEQALRRGLAVFSADRYNFVATRRADIHTHSWPIPAADLRIDSIPVAKGLPLERTML